MSLERKFDFSSCRRVAPERHASVTHSSIEKFVQLNSQIRTTLFRFSTRFLQGMRRERGPRNSILSGVEHEMLLLRLEAASHVFLPPLTPVSSMLSPDTTFPRITAPCCGTEKAFAVLERIAHKKSAEAKSNIQPSQWS